MLNFFKKDKETPKDIPPGISQVKHIIAVASGKGGVGKSTVTTNLAVALAQQGHKVGLIDADIYGPSQPAMLGEHKAPKGVNGSIAPLEIHGVRFISMGVLNPKGGAVVMRAPLATKAITQFLVGVLWGELDFLLIDLPPGTGDIQLSLAQQARLSGSIIVTTPQKVAREISRKALEMFENLNIPTLGVIENMSGFTCSHCHQTTAIFKQGGGQSLGEELKVPYLGAIPLDPAIMQSGDDGIPVVVAAPESHSAQCFQLVVQKLIGTIDDLQKNYTLLEPEKMQVFQDTGKVDILWKDQSTTTVDPYTLRIHCPCASCVDELTGKRILDPSKVSLDIKILGARNIGRYGLAVNFSDGHNTGIYKFKNVKALMNNNDEISV
jgi:ATP-binding protein involved in chromosome partitioning